jgi:hypothetical protein
MKMTGKYFFLLSITTGASMILIIKWQYYNLTPSNTIISTIETIRGKSDDSFPIALDPDNWQTVRENISYVYAAHLDPQSNETYSWIIILGLLRRDIMKDLTRQNTSRYYYCRLWYKLRDQQTNDVITAQVDDLQMSLPDVHRKKDNQYVLNLFMDKIR